MKKCMNPDIQAFEFKPKKHVGIKAVSILAAALVLVVIGTVMIPKIVKTQTTPGSIKPSYENTKRSFMIIASSGGTVGNDDRELGEDVAVAIGGIAHAASSSDVDITDPNKKVTFFTEEAYFDLYVQGEGIKSVTYRLNRGKLSAKTEYGNLHGTGATDTFFGTEADSTGLMRFYDTLTVDLNSQDSSDDSMNGYYGAISFITGGYAEDYNAEIIQRYWHSFDKDLDYSGIVEETDWINDYMEICKQYYDEVFGQIELYITVEYADGSTQIRTISFSVDAEETTEERSMLLYSIDDVNHTAEVVHHLDEARGVIYSNNPNYHLGEHPIDTDDDGVADTKLIFDESDVVIGYDYTFEFIINGQLQKE